MTARGQDVAGLLASAAQWRLLSLLFARPSDRWRAEVAGVAREVTDPLLRRAAEGAEAAGEGAYHALLGPGGSASPREAAHLGFWDPGRLLSDLASFYSAFGYAADGEDPDDHLTVQCGFVSYLFLKEAYALCAGKVAHAEVARGARARFLEEHAATAGRGFAARLPEGSPPYLRDAADALAGRLPESVVDLHGSPDDDRLGCGCDGPGEP